MKGNNIDLIYLDRYSQTHLSSSINEYSGRIWVMLISYNNEPTPRHNIINNIKRIARVK